MAYSPADAVVVLRVNPVVVDTTVTVAPGTTALLVSVIVPAITPVSAWPNRQTEAISRTPSKLTTFNVVFFISNTSSCCRLEYEDAEPLLRLLPICKIVGIGTQDHSSRTRFVTNPALQVLQALKLWRLLHRERSSPNQMTPLPVATSRLRSAVNFAKDLRVL